jgi:hypothetical protein
MTARNKARPFTSQSYREIGDGKVKPGHEKELAAAAERFTTTLRSASVETGPRSSKSAAFLGGEQPLWTAAFESDWHRYIGRMNPSTLH